MCVRTASNKMFELLYSSVVCQKMIKHAPGNIFKDDSRRHVPPERTHNKQADRRVN